jgi:hypothetical protein
MEEEIIFEEERIIEQKIDNLQKDEEKDSQKEQNSSQETSQYEKNSEKDIKFEPKPDEKTIKEVKDEVENKAENLELISTYILKYSRSKEELKELSKDTNLKKAGNCSFMLNIKLTPKNLVSNIPQNKKKEEGKTPQGEEKFLIFYCHEIAAFSFDEIYERIYPIEELCKENKYFRIFETTDDAKIIIDELIQANQNNPKKFFIEFKDNELKIHMKLSFFDKEQEILFNIPKKKLTIEEKNNLLPNFLKEIQEKMNRLDKEYKKLKYNNLTHSDKNKEFKNDNIDESNKKLNKTEINEIRNNESFNESFNDTNNITLRSKIPKYKRKKINKKDYIEEKFY